MGIPFLCVSINCTDGIHKRMRLREKKRRKEERKRSCQIFTFCWIWGQSQVFHDCFFSRFVSLLRSFLPIICSPTSFLFISFHSLVGRSSLFSLAFPGTLHFFLSSPPHRFQAPTQPHNALEENRDKLGKLFLLMFSYLRLFS